MNLQPARHSRMPRSQTAPDQYTLLVVDDNEANRDMLSRRLSRQGYGVITAEDGIGALKVLGEHEIDLVLLDIMMPRMDGYQVLERMRADNLLRRVPVIVITAVDEISSVVKCIGLGAEDYLPKPFNPVLFRARVSACLEKKRLRDLEERYRRQIERHNAELGERVQQQVQEIASAQLGAIFAMSKLAESRDPETGEHLERMREYCKILSLQLGKLHKYSDLIDQAFVDNIYAASPLHDIGKVAVQDAILCKPGKLNLEEWDIMKTHPAIGAETLREVDRQHPGNAFLRTGVDIAQSHHERWNGGGYPNGLAGEAIPLEARILALGDVYDALTSKRCYKEAFSVDKACQLILEEKGIHFDPDVVDAFLEKEAEFSRVRSFFPAE